MEMERGFSISIRQVSQQKFDQCESASAYGTCISIASVMCDLLQSIEPAWITLVDGQKKRGKNQMKSNANVNVNKMLI